MINFNSRMSFKTSTPSLLQFCKQSFLCLLSVNYGVPYQQSLCFSCSLFLHNSCREKCTVRMSECRNLLKLAFPPPSSVSFAWMLLNELWRYFQINREPSLGWLWSFHRNLSKRLNLHNENIDSHTNSIPVMAAVAVMKIVVNIGHLFTKLLSLTTANLFFY